LEAARSEAINAPEGSQSIHMGLLVIVLLLLVIAPTVLYLIGRGAKNYTDKKPEWIGFPSSPDKSRIESPGKDKS
jgi:hypothetical protein